MQRLALQLALLPTHHDAAVKVAYAVAYAESVAASAVAAGIVAGDAVVACA